MPELPEVEVVRRGLAPHVVGARILEVEVLDARSLRRHREGPDHFRASLVGRAVSEVVRRGKFMWVTFSYAAHESIEAPKFGDALVIHLGMSGQLRVFDGAAECGGQASAPSSGPTPDPRTHVRVRLFFDNGVRVDFIDQRIFGGMHVAPLVPSHDGRPGGHGSSKPLIPASASHIARDILDPALDRRALVATIRGRGAAIKSLLLDQSVVSGVGNIYADEALWSARLHYAQPGKTISARKVGELIDATRSVMERALEVGGTSFDTLYVNVDGRSGYFARSLNAYGKAGQPCARCGRDMVREQYAGRGSTRCPKCQKLKESKTN